MPKITVLIPAYNAATTLAQTLDSLRAQTFQDFDVMVVNDASSDNTLEVANSYRTKMALTVLDLARNSGVAGALNQGLAQITAPLIARIDADDLARPDRLAVQHGFLAEHPDIDVCSSALELFDQHKVNDGIIVSKPRDDTTIKTELLKWPSMSHGASLFRKSFFDDVGLFDVRLDYAEDYDLWVRGTLLGKRYANLPDALTLYRQHATQVGRVQAQAQYGRDLAVKRKYISALLDGGSAGNLAEFFCGRTNFTTRAVTTRVFEESFPLLLKLAPKIADPKRYSELVAEAIKRHMAHMDNIS